jgi:hypothetical protein
VRHEGNRSARKLKILQHIRVAAPKSAASTPIKSAQKQSHQIIGLIEEVENGRGLNQLLVRVGIQPRKVAHEYCISSHGLTYGGEYVSGPHRAEWTANSEIDKFA